MGLKGRPTLCLINTEFEKLSSDELLRSLVAALHETAYMINTADTKKDYNLYTKLYADVSKLSPDIKKMDLTDKQKIIDTTLKLNSIQNSLKSDIGTLVSNEIYQKIQQLGSRRTQEQFERCILQLCNIKPFTATQLAQLFDVQPDYIKTRFIKKLLNENKKED